MNECKYCAAPCGEDEDVCYSCDLRERVRVLEKQLEDAEDKLGACVNSVTIWQDMQEESAKRAKLWKRLAKKHRADVIEMCELYDGLERRVDAATVAIARKVSLRKLWKRLAKTLRSDLADAERLRDEYWAELRKYEPSDGVMVQLLVLNDRIREAARLLASEEYKQETEDFHVRLKQWRAAREKWFAHPAVVAARKFDKEGE